MLVNLSNMSLTVCGGDMRMNSRVGKEWCWAGLLQNLCPGVWYRLFSNLKRKKNIMAHCFRKIRGNATCATPGNAVVSNLIHQIRFESSELISTEGSEVIFRQRVLQGKKKALSSEVHSFFRLKRAGGKSGKKNVSESKVIPLDHGRRGNPKTW